MANIKISQLTAKTSNLLVDDLYEVSEAYGVSYVSKRITGQQIVDGVNENLPNALADGQTKGISTFSSNDFNSSIGVISIDYANGQSADTNNKGFLTSSDWNNFNGKANLVNGKIPSSELPAVAISDFLGTVSSQSAMLSLVGQVGDWCIRTDLNKTYIIVGSDPSILSNWQEVSTPTSPVTSVNGQIGVVVLNKNDIGLNNVDNTSDLNKPISTLTQSSLNLKVPTVRNITINGVTQDLSTDRSWTISTSISIGSTPITSGTSGRILFEGVGNIIQESPNLFWDSTNNRLGIGTSSPLYKLHIQDNINGQLRMQATNSSTGSLGETLFGAFMTGNRYAAARQFGSGATGTYITGVNKQSLSLFESGNDSSAILISAANPNAFISFATATVEKARIDNVGNFLIGRNTAGTSATRSIVQANGTAPTSSPADSYQQYSADITTGNAAPHFRTENGSVVKLYQETTGVSAATLVSNAGTTLKSTDTFDGYTIQQVVKALRNLGILA